MVKSVSHNSHCYKSNFNNKYRELSRAFGMDKMSLPCWVYIRVFHKEKPMPRPHRGHDYK